MRIRSTVGHGSMASRGGVDECRQPAMVVPDGSWPAWDAPGPAVGATRVDERRAVLDFSEWTRPQEEATEAFETVREGEKAFRHKRRTEPTVSERAGAEGPQS